MAYLPAELIDHIISYLVAEGHHQDADYSQSMFHILHWDIYNNRLALAPYAAVSRAWQQRVEATTFAHIMLTPARLAAPLAAQALTPERVRRFVRSIRIDLVLPPYGEDAWARREDEAERARNDAVFTDVVRKVFGLLAPAASGIDTGYRPRMHLILSARCISDTDDLEARNYRWRVCEHTPADIREARYDSSYLDLRPPAGSSVQDEAEALPELHCVQAFKVLAGRSQMNHKTSRCFTPRSICLMASRMPRLEEVDWTLCDNEKRDVALRKSLRTDFAYALQLLPSSLRIFELYYDRYPPLDHSFQTPSILDEEDGDNNDKLSLAFHKLSRHLVRFTLIANVGPEAVWPLERAQDDEPLWPRMRDYCVFPGAIAPSGEWRVLRSDPDPDYESDDAGTIVLDHTAPPGDEWENPFRSKLDRNAANAFLLATARAARRMPVLWNLHFNLQAPQGCEAELEVEYRAKAYHPGGENAELEIYATPRVFHLDEEVLQIWREVAEEYGGAGSELVVKETEPPA